MEVEVEPMDSSIMLYKNNDALIRTSARDASERMRNMDNVPERLTWMGLSAASKTTCPGVNPHSG